jgi:hypothetical protein
MVESPQDSVQNLELQVPLELLELDLPPSDVQGQLLELLRHQGTSLVVLLELLELLPQGQLYS